MRLRERIPIVLEKINIAQFLYDIGYVDDISSSETKNIVFEYLQNEEELKEHWVLNQNLRLVQILVHLGLLENKPGMWFYKEETDYLIEKGLVKFEDINFWGVNLTPDGKEKLPETKFVPLSQLTSDHIRNIIKHFEKHVSRGMLAINLKYLEYFNNRLKKEGELKSEGLLKGLFESNEGK